jgi:phosphoadenosine phosphosulfate reductase
LGKSFVNPIFCWSVDDVWEYIRGRGLRYCELYDQGFDRIGCIGCPMTGKHRDAEFARYPGVKRAYIAAMDKAIVRREARWVDPCDGKIRPVRWTSGQEMFDWWVGNG